MSNISQINVQPAFPLSKTPLVHCITNDISLETVANALLYVGAKPLMADYPAEFADIFQQTDALLLNLGHLSRTQVTSLKQASKWAYETNKPTVLDVVGITATKLRNNLAHELLEKTASISVVKGNISEMRTFCGLYSHGRGVDSSNLDQENGALSELKTSLRKVTQEYPHRVFLATGQRDLIVSYDKAFVLENGVFGLDSFTGSGDIVGALIAALLGTKTSPLQAVLNAVSYFNLCGEQAAKKNDVTTGIATFRHLTLDQLSLLSQDHNWTKKIRAYKLDDHCHNIDN